MIRVETLVLGGLETNCYLAWNPDTKRGFLVDPGSDPERILDEIRERGLKIEAILLTHGHFDHMLAVPDLKPALSVKVYCGVSEAEVLRDPKLNLSPAYAGVVMLEPDVTLSDGEETDVAGFRVRTLETPGHTKGSVSYYLPEENLVFSGDTLFCETFGNTKLPTGSFPDIIESVRNKLLTLPDETRVLPGHDMETTVAHEKRYNPLKGYSF